MPNSRPSLSIAVTLLTLTGLSTFGNLSGVSTAQTLQGLPMDQAPACGTIATNSSTRHASSKLAAAIQAFNTQSLTDPLGKQQAPLAYEEVVAAIRLTSRQEHLDISDSLFASFQRIAQTGMLPRGAELEVLTSLDPGGDFVFDTWYVRLTLPKDDGSGGTYSFPLRSNIVRSHPVAEVARDLETRLQKMPAEPGRYRLEERLNELKKRATNAP